MNKTERRMLDLLRELKECYHVIAVKAEFEAEGSRTEELIKLNEVVFRADMDIVIKIGGCEAIRDMYECRLLGAKGVMAPMIETPFAMKKFISSINKVFDEEEKRELEFIINAETLTCFENYDEILKVPGASLVNSVVVGRSDLSSSLGIAKADINNDVMLEKTRIFLEKSRAAGMIASMGGGLSMPDTAALRFIEKLRPLLDRFETRKVIFKSPEAIPVLSEGLKKAIEFEILHLRNKCEYYNRLSKADEARLESMCKAYEKLCSGE